MVWVRKLCLFIHSFQVFVVASLLHDLNLVDLSLAIEVEVGCQLGADHHHLDCAVDHHMVAFSNRVQKVSTGLVCMELLLKVGFALMTLSAKAVSNPLAKLWA